MQGYQYSGAYPYAQFTSMTQPPLYTDRMAQLQAVQQGLQQPPLMIPTQRTGLSGRVVDSIEQVTANEVPMDGSFAVFPQKDCSEINVKYWTGDGKIATVRFKPTTDSQPELVTPDATSLRFDGLEDVLGRLYDKVDKLSNRVDEALKGAKNPVPQRGRKEVTLDE